MIWTALPFALAAFAFSLWSLYPIISAELLAIAAAAVCGGAAAAILMIGRRRARTPDPIAAMGRVLANAGGAQAITAVAGGVLYENGAAQDIWGEMAPLAFFKSNLAEDYDGADEGIERLEAALAANIAAGCDLPILGDGLEPDWFHVRLQPIDGTEGAVLWSVEDITARKAIDEILTQERQDLAEFLHFMPTGVYSVDVEGRFVFVNNRFAEWLGTSPEKLEGTALDEVIAGPNSPEADGAWTGEVKFASMGQGDGFTAYVLQSTFDDAGMTRTRTIVVRLPEDDQAIGAAGREAEKRFRALFNAAPVGIALTDTDGMITDSNRALEQLTGQSRKALLDTPLDSLVSEADSAAFAGLLGPVLAGQRSSAQLDIRLVGQGDGEGRQVSVYAGPLQNPDAVEDAEVDGTVVHIIDTSEQKSLEAQFAQAQKMQAMGQLAGGVAHDFNNLLTAMIGFCDLLLQRHAAGDPSFGDIMQIKQNANRAANLVRQLLAFSRKQPLQAKDLSVTDALTEMSHLLTRLMGETIELKLIHGRDLVAVRVDPGQFDQVIINLAVNARDAMPGGGTLTITTEAVTIDTPIDLGAEQAPAGEYVKISVQDTGNGIAPEHLARIFEPFFSTKHETPGAGTGLGLSTVYGIVRQTGGFILVESKPGEGAHFNIHLPRVQAEAAVVEHEQAVEPPPPAEQDAAPDGTTVLLVEDEDAVRVFAARALKNKGYTILEARTGEQALDIMRDAPDVDLMITDMMMPGMDGATLASLIRVERPEIKVLLISGYSEEVARGEVLDTPDIHFLPKPFSLGQLASRVSEVMRD